jgi:hypothetical protein
VKLQFDANQRFQHDAMADVADLFDGQAHGPPEYAVIAIGDEGGLFAGQERTELGVGNRLLSADTPLPVDVMNDIACNVDPLVAAISAASVYVSLVSLVLIDLTVGLDRFAETRPR